MTTTIEPIKNPHKFNNVLAHLAKSGLVSSQTSTALHRYFEFFGDDLMKELMDTNENSNDLSDELESFAITLAFYSTKAYEFLRNDFAIRLPELALVRSWQQRMDGMPGLTLSGISAIKKRILSWNKKGVKLMFALQMRQIATIPKLEYDKVSQTVVGVEDFGYVDRQHFSEDDEEHTMASHIIFFVLNCVNDGVHIQVPVAYFMVSGLDGKQKANVVSEVILFLERNEIRIISLICDARSHENDVEMCTELGADFEPDDVKSYFKSPTGNKIHIIFDTAHILAIIRNTLAYKGVIVDVDEQPIKWELIKNLYKLQSSKGLHLDCELTKTHIIDWGSNLFNIDLVLETMNRKVASAILSLSKNQKYADQFVNVESTVKYLIMLNDLFEMFNAKNGGASLEYPHQLIQTENYKEIFKTMDEIDEYIRNCTIKNTGRNPAAIQFIKGHELALLAIRSNIQTFYNLFDELVINDKVLKYVIPFRFSNQNLETFLTMMKRSGGVDFDECPTALEFLIAYRKLLISKSNKPFKDAAGHLVIETKDVFTNKDKRNAESGMI